MTIAIPRDRYHGAFIEFKTDTGTVSTMQRKYLEALEAQGYKIIVPRSFEEARNAVLEYLGETECTSSE